MNALRRVMLLIDADNVSGDVIEQAVQRTLTTHGAAHVRRAYCNAETALKQQALFKRLSVRAMVNLSAGKNSTDIAMAVDAMDLVIAERPDLVVLVSSDSDFAPLVVRLREKGCRVCGIGQRGKTGEETRAAYDEFIDLTHQGARAPAASTASSAAPLAASESDAEPASRPARKTAARKSTRAAAAPPPPLAANPSEAEPASRPARKAAAKKSARAPAPAAPSPSTQTATPAARPAARKATRKTATAAPALPNAPAKRAPATSAPVAPASDTAERILQAVPALRGGSEVALNDIAKALRGAKLLGKHASSIKLFDKLPSEFAVLQHPDRIRWLGAARR
ncbi:MAG: NYN domain-containing protein [Comamonadaceae bacterium]|nr:MAG: NYN domain-containing protein [Comamonadaceae bacterium]